MTSLLSVFPGRGRANGQSRCSTHSGVAWHLACREEKSLKRDAVPGAAIAMSWVFSGDVVRDVVHTDVRGLLVYVRGAV
jgi:hypothetical protein